MSAMPKLVCCDPFQYRGSFEAEATREFAGSSVSVRELLSSMSVVLGLFFDITVKRRRFVGLLKDLECRIPNTSQVDTSLPHLASLLVVVVHSVRTCNFASVLLPTAAPYLHSNRSVTNTK